MSTVMVEAYRCQRCEHYWLPQVKRRAIRPKVCPSCKSPIWDKARAVMLPPIQDRSVVALPVNNGEQVG